MLDIEWGYLQKNIVVYNIDESSHENCETLCLDALTKVFDIDKRDLKSSENQSGLIEIDTAYRIGKPGGEKGRPILLKFTTQKGKDIVMRQVRAKKRTGNIKVSDHLPSVMKEKRMAQVEDLKQSREMYKNSGKRVALVKDKLMVGSQVILDAFEKNKLPSMPTSTPPSIKEVAQTPVEDVKGSLFKGFAARVNSVRQAAEIREALYQCQHVSQSDHTIYAYTVTDDSGMKITGYSDDGEWTASKILMNQLLEKQYTNTFIAVSRIHNGPNLGKMRFNIVSRVADAALNLLN